jgi:hypothetical protein
MKFFPGFILLFFFHKNTSAQNLEELKLYLDSNHTTINWDQPNSTFNSVMKNKSLFVLGECNHNLNLNNELRIYLVNQFSRHLKYFFIENSRSWAFIYNNYLQGSITYVDSILKNKPAYAIKMKKVRETYQSGCRFQYRGIDMEWARGIYYAVKSVTGNLNYSIIRSIPFLHSILIDTNYLHYNDNDDFNEQKQFLKYYKKLQSLFLKDSGSLQNNLTHTDFQQLKYFFSNPQTAPPTGNRNPGMAKNLLNEINPIDSSATYLADLGMAHTLLNFNRGVVGTLNRSELLADKIVVMNTYCDECIVNGKKVDNSALKFMKGEVLETFRSVAQSDLTIFDLSKAPPQFAYLKKYGDLILFAKHQQ